MQFWLAAGSDYTGGTTQTSWGSQTNGNRAHGLNVNIADSTSNEWLITGIQLEVDHTGSGVATDFEHRSYGQELALCQRYFYKSQANGVSFLATTNNDSRSRINLSFPTTMRTAPSGSMSNYTLSTKITGFTGYQSSSQTDVLYEGTFDAEL